MQGDVAESRGVEEMAVKWSVAHVKMDIIHSLEGSGRDWEAVAMCL